MIKKVLIIIFLMMSGLIYSQTERVAIGFGAKYAIPSSGFNSIVKNGYGIDGNLLFAAGKNVGIELCVGNAKWKFKDDSGSSLENWSVLTGVKYFANLNTIIPYVSANMGIQFNSLKLKGIEDSTVISNYETSFDSKSSFIGQFGLGFIYRLTKKLSFDSSVNYRAVKNSSYYSINAGILYNIY